MLNVARWKPSWRIAAFVLGMFPFWATPAWAVKVRLAITVDNSYALYYGTETEALKFVGSDVVWQTTETYDFDLPADNYLYVVTASDAAVAQGILASLQIVETRKKFLTGDPAWQVTATGLGPQAPYSGSAQDLADLTEQIHLANNHDNISKGWNPVTAVRPNLPDNTWGFRSGIDHKAKWGWYSSNGVPDPTAQGWDHFEWLIFRIKVMPENELSLQLYPTRPTVIR